MKINTKLLINIALPIAASLMIVSIMAASLQMRDEAERKNGVAFSLLSDMNDLNQRTNYYLLYKEERAKNEWFSIFDSLSSRIAGMRFENIDQDAALDRIRKNLGEFRDIFIRRIREEAPPDSAASLVRERQDMLSGQLLVRARSISLDANRLYQLTNDERRLYRRQLNTVIVLVLSAWLLITLFTLLPMNRAISRSLSRLTEGAAAIGSGNLSHRIGLRTRDELGQLSEAFDSMTENLKAITVSRDELAKEITERRKAEEALRKSEAILKQAGEIAHLGAWEIEFSNDRPVDENPLHWSDEVYRIFGYHPGSVPVSNNLFFERVHPDDRARIRDAVAGAIALKTPYSIEHRVIRADGSERTVFEHAEIVFKNGGRPVRIIGAVQDITDRKRIEEALKQNERFLQMIIDTAPACVKLVASDGSLLMMNREGLAIIGAESFEQVQGKSIFSLVASPYRRAFIDLTEKVFQGEPGKLEFEAVDLRGRHIWLNTHAVPLHDNAGNVTALLGITVDITDRRQAEEQLRKLLADLERSNKELEQFAYVASHDLQEPLRMVASYVQLLEKKYKGRLDEKAERYIYFAVDGVKRMQNLIDGLLAYSRVARGAPFTRVDTGHALNRAILNLSSTIRENGAAVTAGPLPAVTGDEIQLTQLFQNLIANAVKFRKPDAAPEVRIGAERLGKEWVFSVRDNGIGLDPQFSRRIFLIFQRLHSRNEYPGTGIGLALCKRIVERHRGSIWVESEPGKGSSFFFTIPAENGL